VTTTVLTRAVARMLLAPVLLVAAGILIKGYTETGDGFTAGLVAALGILLQYVVFGGAAVAEALPVRHAPRLAIGGLLVVLALTFVPVAFGEPLLTHWPGPDRDVVHIGTLELMTPVLFDIGVFALVAGVVVTFIDLLARPEPEEEQA
jgi:multisubunit Na+/H+ antiporter MnhB subunit